MSRTIAVIRLSILLQQPLYDRRMAAGHCPGQCVVARSIRCCGVHVRAFGEQILSHLAMPKYSGQRKDGKSVRRKTVRQRRICVDDLLHTRKLPRRRCFMQFQCNAASEKQITKLIPPAIHGQEHRRLSLFIFCGCKRSVGIEERLHFASVPGLDGLKEGSNVAHRRTPGELVRAVSRACNAGNQNYRRERSLRTASSISASSSLHVTVTSSPAFSPLSRVMGNSAPPPAGVATKYPAQPAMSLATSRLESNAGSPAISAASVIFALCSMVSIRKKAVSRSGPQVTAPWLARRSAS